MRKLESYQIRVLDNGNIATNSQIIGLRRKSGEIVVGTYTELEGWTPSPILPRYIKMDTDVEQVGSITTITHKLICTQELPPNTYIAVKQRFDEDIIAITPLSGTNDTPLHMYVTYYFSEEGDPTV